jgi:hypothetical protein
LKVLEIARKVGRGVVPLSQAFDRPVASYIKYRSAVLKEIITLVLIHRHDLAAHVVSVIHRVEPTQGAGKPDELGIEEADVTLKCRRRIPIRIDGYECYTRILRYARGMYGAREMDERRRAFIGTMRKSKEKGDRMAAGASKE